MELILFGMVLPWLLLAFAAWLGYQLVRQNGRMLLRLDALEEKLTRLVAARGGTAGGAPEPEGLPAGAAAPAFELPDLTGEKHALSEWRGKKTLLIFFNPRCGFCARMAPDLARLPADGAEARPVPVVVTAGDPAANRLFMAEHGIRCPVLLQQGNEVAEQFRAHGTPTGYLLDADGRIASPLAIGAQALLDLAAGKPPGLPANGRRPSVGTRDLSRSKIRRDGLEPGTPAPDFTLPRLDGGELSLAEFRGRKALLVFSAPHCGPCEALLPELEQFHRQGGDTAVVMIGRGDAEENRQKVRQHQLTFPVALQKQWEVSRQYAMFATPVAYLVDEEGAIAAPVAVGKEPVMALARHAAAIAGSGPRTAPEPA